MKRFRLITSQQGMKYSQVRCSYSLFVITQRSSVTGQIFLTRRSGESSILITENVVS